MPRTRLLLPIATLMLTLWLTACGQKGPLYLPDPADQPDEQQQSE